MSLFLSKHDATGACKDFLHTFVNLAFDRGEWSITQPRRFAPMSKPPLPFGDVSRSGYYEEEIRMCLSRSCNSYTTQQ